MSSSAERLAASSPGASLPSRRWAALIALLLGEMVALTVSFDGASLARGMGWWSSWLGQSSQIPRAAIATAVAAVVFGGSRLRVEWLRQVAEDDRPHRFWPPLLIHLAAFASFAQVTAFVFEGGLHESASSGGWALAWLATGLVALAGWAAAAVPPRLWWPLARGGRDAIGVGVTVGVMAWGLGRLADQFWEPLARGTLFLVDALLRLAVPDPICRPEEFLVGTAAFQVTIAPQCSGYEGIGLIWAFLAAYLWLWRESLRFPRAWLLIPLGTAIIWSVNAVRIAVLVAVGTWISADIAAGGFHSQAGWLAFNAIALGLVLVSRRSRLFIKVDPAVAVEAGENPAAAALAPLLSIVAVTMITGAFTAGFDGFYPLRALAVASTLYYFRGAYGSIRRVPSWTAVAVGVVTFAVWMALEPAAPGDSAASPLALGLARMSTAGAATWLAFRVVGSVILVPIAEELAFRDYLVRRLIAADVTTIAPGRFTWLSFLGSSVLFGALHGRWLAGTLAGMAYAIALYRRGEVVDAIAAHGTTNALIACFTLATGTWSLWA